MNTKKIIELTKELISSSQVKIKYVLQFAFVVILYGLIINFALAQFIHSLTFSIKNIIATGIIAYIVKVELPQIISSSLPRIQLPPNL